MKKVIMFMLILSALLLRADMPTLDEVKEAFSSKTINCDKEIAMRSIYQDLHAAMYSQAEFPQRAEYIEIIMQGFESLREPMILNDDENVKEKKNARAMGDRIDLFLMAFVPLHELGESPELQLRIAKKLGEIKPIINLHKDTRINTRCFVFVVKEFRHKMLMVACGPKQRRLRYRMGEKEFLEFRNSFIELGGLDEKEIKILDKAIGQ